MDGDHAVEGDPLSNGACEAARWLYENPACCYEPLTFIGREIFRILTSHSTDLFPF